MKVTCTGRRVTLKPSFIENAEKRLAKLDKFFSLTKHRYRLPSR